MLSSRAVRIGATVAMLVGSLACADGEETTTVQTEYGEICARYNRATGEYDVRVPFEECDNDPDHIRTYPIFIHQGGGHTAPAVGSKIVPGSFKTSVPAGATTARPPATGGFGTHTTTAGS